jgi:NDP-sugar pyrophosphorylase family protein
VKALILAAGLGTRLGMLTRDQPKPMLHLAGRPLLEHTIALLHAHGVRDVAINLHFYPDIIRAYFGDGSAFGVRLVYSEERLLLGTAGAAKRLQAFLNEPFYVMYGDVLTDIDLSELADWHCSVDADLTMALYRVEDPTRAGIVEVDGDGRVVRFVEKPRPAAVFSDLANSGILIVQPRVLDGLPTGAPLDFGQHVIPRLIRAGRPVYGRLASGYIVDIGSPERYVQAESDVAAGRVRLVAPSSPVPHPPRLNTGPAAC